MLAAAVVVPLAAMVLPIVLVLLAVLFDVLFLGWTVFRMWHDEWAVRVGAFAQDHLFHPLRSVAHPRHPVPGAR
ncbi:MAG: hypothetical protein HUU26_03050 [Gemmatimonadaceae bacterium]|nr:hypothetical protein [Gemmatimonadaceae bacterium]